MITVGARPCAVPQHRWDTVIRVDREHWIVRNVRAAIPVYVLCRGKGRESSANATGLIEQLMLPLPASAS